MKRKVLAVALPLTLMLGVGCSKDSSEESKTEDIKVEDYKTTDSLKDAETKREESEKGKFMKRVDEEMDKEALVQNPQASKETNAKEQANGNVSADKQELVAYQNKVNEGFEKFKTDLEATIPITQKDMELKTNKAELKEQYGKVKAEAIKLSELEPPKEYPQFKEDLKTNSDIISLGVDQLFDDLLRDNTEKARSTKGDILDGLKYLKKTVEEIRRAGK
ncbi:hypothetical protein [Bacillus toyonensis]|uniref:hypothetical protein n=1 Tax=Bacillus toyonensis TaxID=155322 RepID=UPI000BF68480|nr:hypothetical protein [Bacillus toyonensis]PGF05289.1 hypothetical protein COM61_02440 [Bacillus toyonensis]